MGQGASREAVIMVRRSLALAVLVASICGCAGEQLPGKTNPPEIQAVTPTRVYCQIEKLDKPALPISRLRSDSSPHDTISSFAATVAILKAAVRERDREIARCIARSPDRPNDRDSRSAGTCGSDEFLE